VQTILLDACVLYPATLRDFLLRLVEAGVFRGHMSRDILDECFRSVARDRPELGPKLKRTRQILETAFSDLLVEGYEPLIGGIELPDPDDRHVLAAAIAAEATHIVTFNLRDFPAELLARHGVVAVHPDALVLAFVEAQPEIVVDVVHAQAAGLRNPPMSGGMLVDRLARQGLVGSAAALRGLVR
jgi:predicted nucleic acid-binding protein